MVVKAVIRVQGRTLVVFTGASCPPPQKKIWAASNSCGLLCTVVVDLPPYGNGNRIVSSIWIRGGLWDLEQSPNGVQGGDCGGVKGKVPAKRGAEPQMLNSFAYLIVSVNASNFAHTFLQISRILARVATSPVIGEPGAPLSGEVAAPWIRHRVFPLYFSSGLPKRSRALHSARFCRIQRTDDARMGWDLIEWALRARKNLTLCAEFRYLLPLNEALFRAFSVDFHNNRN